MLLAQDVFLSYSPISQTVARQLYGTAGAARRGGYPIKVALIAAPSDLGAVPSLFGRPQSYARFLSAELTAARTPVLVVMPNGFGLAVGGHPRSAVALAGVKIGGGADGLAAAAIAATRRLAAAAGHPLSGAATGSSSSLGASASTIRHAVIAMLALAVVAGAAIGTAAAVRSRSHG